MMMRRFRIVILCSLAVMPLLSISAAAEKLEGGTVSFELFGMDNPNGALPRLELYNYLPQGNVNMGLTYWTDRHPGRHDVLTITNPGEQDHELSLLSNTDSWRLELSENRIFHSISKGQGTKREYDTFSVRYVQPGETRMGLTVKSMDRTGNLSATQPVGQSDMGVEALAQTPAGSVSASLKLYNQNMSNDADNKTDSGMSGLYSYKPGLPFSAVVSMKSGALNNTINASVPSIKNDSVAVDVSLRLNTKHTLTANAKFDNIDAASDALSTDDSILGVGLHCGNSRHTMNLNYSVTDRDMAGIQTTSQEVSRVDARLSLKMGRRSRLRAGVRQENRDVSSSLSPSLKSFAELGSEKSELWINASVPVFRTGGSASVFARAKTIDYTLAPGVNLGTTSSDSSNYGLTTLLPMGKADFSYSYYHGENNSTFNINELTAAGKIITGIESGNDQDTHSVSLNWTRGSKTDVEISSMLGTGHAGGLFEASRTRETDTKLTITHRFDSRRTGSVTLRKNDYEDNLSSVFSERSLYVGASLTRSF